MRMFIGIKMINPLEVKDDASLIHKDSKAL